MTRAPALPLADYKRPHMSLSVKLAAALHLLGLDPGKPIEWNHAPPLATRPWDDATRDFVPAANDPRHIEPLQATKHRRLTAEVDAPDIAKTRRNGKGQAVHLKAMLTKDYAEQPVILGRGKRAWPKGRKIASRPFPKRAAPMNSRAEQQ